MEKNKFDKLWKEFIDSKFDVGITRRKTACNFLRFIEDKHTNKEK